MEKNLQTDTETKHIHKKRQSFRRLVSLPRTYFFLLKSIYKQKRFIKIHLEKDLAPFKDTNDGSLTKDDFNKIRSYYALGVPAILGESMAVLRGRSLTINERLCLTFLGSVSGLLDDIFDDPNKDEQHLRDFILAPEKLEPANSNEALLVHLYSAGLSFNVHPEYLKLQALQVYQAQERSVQQQTTKSSGQQILEGTYAKGGTSFIFYRRCLEQLPEKAEEQLLFHLGGLMQLGNDIFDTWEDFHAGIATAASTSNSIEQLRADFLVDLRILTQLVQKTSYSKKHKNRFSDIILLALVRVFVCLDQFKKLESSTNNQFHISKYSREQLICDMEKPKNQLKAIRYFISIQDGMI